MPAEILRCTFSGSLPVAVPVLHSCWLASGQSLARKQIQSKENADMPFARHFQQLFQPCSDLSASEVSDNSAATVVSTDGMLEVKMRQQLLLKDSQTASWNSLFSDLQHSGRKSNYWHCSSHLAAPICIPNPCHPNQQQQTP